MDSSLETAANMLDWDEGDVQTWLSSIGFPQYEANILEHHVTGDVLAVLDSETLKEVGVLSAGQRLVILRAVYHLKLAHGVPIGQDDYVPPSEQDEAEETPTLGRLNELLRAQEDRLRALEEDNRRLTETVIQFIDDGSRSSGSRTDGDRSLRKQPSFRWARSPTKPETLHTESPHPSPNRMAHDVSRPQTVGSSHQPSYNDRQEVHRPQVVTVAASPDSSLVLTNNTNRQQPPPRSDSTNISTSSDNLKSFKVSLEDPAWKVLPAALKKYKINNDDWQNYAMFICYGSIERCLSYDDKPLLLFQKLKDAKKNPVFMLKHIKDIRSPIVVAQQKHAARKAAENSSSATKPSPGHNRSQSRPTKLTVGGTPPLNTASNGAAWPVPDILSPSTETKDKMDDIGSSLHSRSGATSGSAVEEGADSSLRARVEIQTSAEVSYAVAIYPYMAEQEDEFDVVVGDTFVILSRAKGWWVVQRDLTGNGSVDPDITKQGWVPAGCLLETNVPVAVAIEAANAQRAPSNVSPPSSPVLKTPILPLSILSTSFPGVALMDYAKKGDEELDLAKDDFLRVFKRYNHWSYAVKETGGDRGWVPSWFIGKVQSIGQVPPTPSVATAASSSTAVNLDSDFRYATSEAGGSSFGSHGNQVSPMSSAFPPPSQASSRTLVM